MASMGIDYVASFLNPGRVRLNQVSVLNRIVSIPNSRFRNPSSLRISASMAVFDIRSRSPRFKDLPSDNMLVNQKDWKLFQGKDSIFADDLDGWVRGSVVEIVKNLKRAPLLVHVYGNNVGLMEVIAEKGFAEEDWPNLKKEWREGERKYPDGIILIEELKEGSDSEIGEEEEERETKAWGILIQGRGLERQCGPACYLLKTCRVNSGVGLFGTHFSLVKVNSFRESAFSQMRNSWLLR